jgi:hypothetical protein
MAKQVPLGTEATSRISQTRAVGCGKIETGIMLKVGGRDEVRSLYFLGEPTLNEIKWFFAEGTETDALIETES